MDRPTVPNRSFSGSNSNDYINLAVSPASAILRCDSGNVGHPRPVSSSTSSNLVEQQQELSSSSVPTSLSSSPPLSIPSNTVTQPTTMATTAPTASTPSSTAAPVTTTTTPSTNATSTTTNGSNNNNGNNNHQNNNHNSHHIRTLSSTANNPTPHRLPEGENATPLEVTAGTTTSDKLVIIMVGLPATGKTHIAKRICRFLSFFHDIPSQIFNVGDYRRQLCGAIQPATFYDPNNIQGVTARTMACDAALADLLEYMKLDGVRVSAFDATNSTKERRKHVSDVLKRSGLGVKHMFVESICDEVDLLEENIRKVKLSTPDYRDMDPEQALLDFHQRREMYMKTYEPVNASDGPHIKIINSREFIVSNIRGYLRLKVVHFVMNLHTLPRTFYLTRHGQSEYNLLGKIGGDSGLTPAGIEYARRLADFAKNHIANTIVIDPITGEERRVARPARMWTSTLRRTKETAQFIDHTHIRHTWDNGETGDWVQFRPMARRNLDELYAGTCDGMTYQEIKEVYPDEFARRQDDKLSYRYPRGESYMDVTLRLEPVAQEMERTREPVLIVGHQGILRILYAYFMGLDRNEAPYVSIPLNNIIELTPHAYGCHEKRFCLMSKQEMLNDGQDEPITSMPVKLDEGGLPKSASTTQLPVGVVSSTPNDLQQHQQQSYRHAVSMNDISNSEYAPNDPIMNAPSC